MKVSVSCLTKFHSFYLAEQLFKRNALKKLFTSYYGRFFSRDNRGTTNISKDYVCTNLFSTALAYGLSPGLLPKYTYFGKWVANRLTNEDIVVTWGLSALPVIRRAHGLGIKVVVERGSSHVLYQREVLYSEYRRAGLDTKALDSAFFTERIERETREYEEADYISVPSLFVKRTFLERGIPEEKLIHIPYGVGIREFRPAPKEDKTFRLIHCGGITLQKGVHYLLQAFYELDLPQSELWLVGGMSAEIQPFFKKYSNGKVFYKGHQPQRELYRYYSQCSVFCLASIQEGLSMVICQAMACGLPVICTTNTGGEDIVRAGVDGFIVPIRDVEALKEKILYMYENSERCREMGESARMRVQSEFSWDDYGERMIKAYQKALSRR